MVDEIWPMFRALGDPTRFKIFNFLRARSFDVAVEDTGEVRRVEGPTVVEVCCHVTGIERASSAISFHLKELRNAGLITMDKRGKYLICRVNRDAMATIETWVQDVADGACA